MAVASEKKSFLWQCLVSKHVGCESTCFEQLPTPSNLASSPSSCRRWRGRVARQSRELERHRGESQ